jgi:hypothetical protein
MFCDVKIYVHPKMLHSLTNAHCVFWSNSDTLHNIDVKARDVALQNQI